MKTNVVLLGVNLALSAVISVSVSRSASAQDTTVASGVYPWSALTARTAPMGETRDILEGVTTPLEHIRLAAETLDAGHSSHSGARHETVEELVIVKDGALRITLKGEDRVLGPGSVAVILPGDAHTFENAADDEATFYAFQYRSREAVDMERGERAGGSFMLDWNEVEKHATDVGSRRDFFDRATAMFDRFEMHVSTLSEGLTNHAAHTHGAEEFVLMTQSRVEMLIGDGYQEASAGDVIFLESMIPHALNNLGSGSTEYFAFQWQ